MAPRATGCALRLRLLLLLASAAGRAARLQQGLRPKDVWHHFEAVLSTPRCSENEAAMANYVRRVAAARGLTVLGDAARNVVVKRPASGEGSAAAEPVIIQTHLDMVCEKNSDWSHDWTKDPISTVIRDGWLVAENTTLGADNGIGVAIALALMEASDEVKLPPLEFLFTVEEETGLFGAERLDVSLLKGRRLLNLDSEEFGFIYIGCAGGGDAIVTLPVGSAALPQRLRPYGLSLRGLRGGHSGADIHEFRGNALVLLARAISELLRAMPQLRLLDLVGGDKDNAIPRESSAVLGLAAEDLPGVQRTLASIERELLQEYGRIDPGLSLHLAEAPLQGDLDSPLSEESAQRLLDLVLGLPNGVIKKSHETPDFMVETSNNVARVRRVDPGNLEVLCFPRSSIRSALEDVQSRIARSARLVGGSVNRTFTFPGWAPNASQALLAVASEELAQVTGSQPKILTIHAGLECGVIGDKIPGIEMVSFGPDIVGAHAPGERVFVDSVAKTWLTTTRLLARLAGDGGVKAPQQRREL